MVRKRKTNKDVPIPETYEIQVEDWEVYYHFGINTAPKDLVDGAYWEFTNLVLLGSILSPTLKSATKARIEFRDDPQMDDHWQPKPTIISAKAVGSMEIPRGDDTLIFYCSVPSRVLPFIALATQSGKVKFATIWGTVLKWRRGTVSTFSLSTKREEL